MPLNDADSVQELKRLTCYIGHLRQYMRSASGMLVCAVLI